MGILPTGLDLGSIPSDGAISAPLPPVLLARDPSRRVAEVESRRVAEVDVLLCPARRWPALAESSDPAWVVIRRGPLTCAVTLLVGEGT